MAGQSRLLPPPPAQKTPEPPQTQLSAPQTGYVTGSPSLHPEPIEHPQPEAPQDFYDVLENVEEPPQTQLSAPQTGYVTGSPSLHPEPIEHPQPEVPQAFYNLLESVEFMNTLQPEAPQDFYDVLENVEEPPQTQLSAPQTGYVTGSPSLHPEPIEHPQPEVPQAFYNLLESVEFMYTLQPEAPQDFYDLLENVEEPPQTQLSASQTGYVTGSPSLRPEPIEHPQPEAPQDFYNWLESVEFMYTLQPQAPQDFNDLLEYVEEPPQTQLSASQTGYVTGSPSLRPEPIEHPQPEAPQNFYDVLENVEEPPQTQLSAPQTGYVTGSPSLHPEPIEHPQPEAPQAFYDVLESDEFMCTLQDLGIIPEDSFVGNVPNKMIERIEDDHQNSKHQEPYANGSCCSSNKQATVKISIKSSGIAKGDEKRKPFQRLIDNKEYYYKIIEAAKNRGLIYLITNINDYITSLSQNGNLHIPKQSDEHEINQIPLLSQLAGLKQYPGSETVTGIPDNCPELGNEDGLVQEIERELIENFKKQNQYYDFIANTDYSIVFPAREPAVKQPTNMINGVLNSDQIKRLNWLVSMNEKNLNGVLFDDIRIEKIILTIALVTYHIEKQMDRRPFLIIVPVNKVSEWTRQFKKWAPSLNVAVYKNPLVLRRPNSPAFQVRWKFLILDVGKRVLNSNIEVMETMNKYYNASHRLILIETLEYRLSSMWALVNFIIPSIFRSTSNFEEWFNKPLDKADLKAELNKDETIMVIWHLLKALRPFILRRLVTEVEDNMLYPLLIYSDTVRTNSGAFSRGSGTNACSLEYALLTDITLSEGDNFKRLVLQPGNEYHIRARKQL